MRWISYILIFSLYSCDDIFEQQEALPYSFSIAEGWSNFLAGNYESAEDFFISSIEIDSDLVPSYTEGFIGLGWTKLYLANTSYGNGYTSEDRYQIRLDALNAFNAAQIELENNLTVDDAYKEILFAGLSYANSVVMLHTNENSSVEESPDSYAESAIEYSDLLINIDSEYYFEYDSTNINSNTIHLLRAQMLLQLEDYISAQEEIAKVNFFSTEISFNVIDTSNQVSNYSNMYLQVGFRGQDKHLFQMEYANGKYSKTRSFTPLLPCLDLIIDAIDLNNDEVIECLDFMPSNILEYKFGIQFPGLIYDESDSTNCESFGFDWIDDICIEEWMNTVENFDEPNSSCITGGYRTLEVFENETLLNLPSACYGSCESCND